MTALFAATALAAGTLSAAPPPAGPPSRVQVGELRVSTSQADLLVRALKGAAEHGLDPSAFVTAELEQALASRSEPERTAGLRRLVAATLDYGRALRSGGLSPSDFPSNWAQRPTAYDPLPSLADALAKDRIGEWLAALPPEDPRYRDLQQALKRYRGYAAGGGWTPLPAGRSLRLGDQDPRIPLLRARLAAEGDGSVAGGSNAFDPALEASLTRFQRLHGPTADGVLGPETLAALNVPASARVAQIAANLERLRWAPRDPPPTRIEVDSGSAALSFYRGGVLTLSMRTIVGRAADPTPMFRDQIEAVVLNPPWNVPITIAVNEILPKAQRDAAYLARNDFVVRPGSGPMAARLQQRPGPKSALGLYKFDMPNGFNVYLHDTPARSLFENERRNLSHGCVRLQKPRELAELVLGDDPGMSPVEIGAALAEGATRRIVLRRPIPVIVSHWTVSALGGEAAFRPDVYGWDARISALLARRR